MPVGLNNGGNNPKEVIKVIVENNSELMDDRTQLIKLINKIRAIQKD